MNHRIDADRHEVTQRPTSINPLCLLPNDRFRSQGQRFGFGVRFGDRMDAFNIVLSPSRTTRQAVIQLSMASSAADRFSHVRLNYIVSFTTGRSEDAPANVHKHTYTVDTYSCVQLLGRNFFEASLVSLLV